MSVLVARLIWWRSPPGFAVLFWWYFQIEAIMQTSNSRKAFELDLIQGLGDVTVQLHSLVLPSCWYRQKCVSTFCYKLYCSQRYDSDSNQTNCLMTQVQYQPPKSSIYQLRAELLQIDLSAKWVELFANLIATAVGNQTEPPNGMNFHQFIPLVTTQVLDDVPLCLVHIKRTYLIAQHLVIVLLGSLRRTNLQLKWVLN